MKDRKFDALAERTLGHQKERGKNRHSEETDRSECNVLLEPILSGRTVASFRPRHLLNDEGRDERKHKII